MSVGLLGLQGAFLDHIKHLKALNAEFCIVRDLKALENIDRLIIPGGESTVMEKFLDEFHMTASLKEKIKQGMPVWGICAGTIILAQSVDNRPGILDALKISVKRNAYGRQLASSEKFVNIPILNRHEFPALFIRAPRIVSLTNGIQVHGFYEDDPVFIQDNHIMATTFHPELTNDSIFHEYFLGL